MFLILGDLKCCHQWNLDYNGSQPVAGSSCPGPVFQTVGVFLLSSNDLLLSHSFGPCLCLHGQAWSPHRVKLEWEWRGERTFVSFWKAIVHTSFTTNTDMTLYYVPLSPKSQISWFLKLWHGHWPVLPEHRRGGMKKVISIKAGDTEKSLAWQWQSLERYKFDVFVAQFLCGRTCLYATHVGFRSMNRGQTLCSDDAE